MIRGHCPTCRAPFAVGSISDAPHFPFCSERCRLIDLGRWADGAYAIPGPELPPAEPPEAELEGDG